MKANTWSTMYCCVLCLLPHHNIFLSLSPLCVQCTLWCRCGHSAQLHIGKLAGQRDLGLGLNIVISRAPNANAMQCDPYNILWQPIFYRLPFLNWMTFPQCEECRQCDCDTWQQLGPCVPSLASCPQTTESESLAWPKQVFYVPILHLACNRNS